VRSRRIVVCRMLNACARVLYSWFFVVGDAEIEVPVPHSGVLQTSVAVLVSCLALYRQVPTVRYTYWLGKHGLSRTVQRITSWSAVQPLNLVLNQKNTMPRAFLITHRRYNAEQHRGEYTYNVWKFEETSSTLHDKLILLSVYIIVFRGRNAKT
jgi:hypothetical protein